MATDSCPGAQGRDREGTDAGANAGVGPVESVRRGGHRLRRSCSAAFVESRLRRHCHEQRGEADRQL